MKLNLSSLSRLGFLLGALGMTGASLVVAQTPPTVFVKYATAQVTSGTTPVTAPVTTIAAPGSGWNFSAAAPVAGTTWNVIQRPNPLIPSGALNGAVGVYPVNSANNIELSSASGDPTAVRLTVSLNIADLEASSSSRVEPNTGTGSNTNLGPAGLMNQAWRIYRGGNGAIHQFSGLPAGAHYYVYCYASNTTGQGSRFTLDAANVPGGDGTITRFIETRSTSGNVFVTDGTTISPSAPAVVDKASAATDATTWGRLHAVVDSSGNLVIRNSKTAAGVNFFQGLQLMPYPVPVITQQPAPLVVGSNGGVIVITVAATGDGSLSYQWRKNGTVLADGATGTGSTLSGATTATLTLDGASAADDGSYDVLVTNQGGTLTSQASVLTVSSSAIAPSIVTQPAAKTGVSGQSTSFTVQATGTSPLTYRWQKSLNNSDFTDVPGAEAAVLDMPSLTTADAGYYRVIVTNSVSSVTSASAALVVAPVLTTSPAGAIVTPSGNHTLSVVADAGAGSPEAISYVWKFNGVTVANGGAYSGATSANLTVSGFSATQSGYYTVTASNSAGSVTSGSIYVGVATAQSVTFAPGNNATGIAIDQQLRIVLSSTPRLGTSGALRVHDAADDSVVAQVDLASFVTYAPGNSTAIIPNAAIRPMQGSSGGTTVAVTNYYYMPIAIYGNEAWVTLPSRLSYGKTYYVTMDAAVLLDSTNAAVPAISSPTAWRFSTKSVALETPTVDSGPAVITIGQDGAGDFATLQAAFDWVPLNNTLLRTIQVLPGVYRDNATLGFGRNQVAVVGMGTKRGDVTIAYPYAYFAPPSSVSTAGTLRVEGNDVTVKNLTLDNLICYPYSPTGRPQNENPALNGATNTLHTTGKRIVFDDVLVKGGQDTYWGNKGISYFYNCEIWGSVDFIYGAALAVFDRCVIVEIRSSGGPIGAPNTVAAQPYGEVFLNCKFPRALVADGYPFDVGLGTTTFMRPWGQDGALAVINCELGAQFSTKGWLEWDGRENTCRAIEYGSTAIGGGATTTPEQRRAAGAYWVNTVDPDYVSAVSPTSPLLTPPSGNANRTVTTVNPSDYTLAAIFGHPYFAADLTGWMPVVQDNVAPTVHTDPLAARVAVGQNVTLSVGASGSPTLLYQWRKNSVNIVGANLATLTLSSVTLDSAGSYDCVVSNGAGDDVSAAATVVVLTPFAVWAETFGLDGTVAGLGSADADFDGVPNLLEYVLGGNPAVADAGRLPRVVVVEDAGQKHLVMEYGRAIAAAGVPVSVQTSQDLSTWLTRTAGVDAEVEVIPYLGTAINVDVNGSVGTNYSGLAIAPGAGVTWNHFGTPASNPGVLSDLVDTQGAPTTIDLSVSSSGGAFYIWTNTTNGAPNPSLLMQDYLFGSAYTFTLSGLPAGNYQLVVYAHGDQDNQTSTITISAGNGGGQKSTATSGVGLFRDVFASGAEGVAYVRLSPTVGADGVLQFTAGNYANGFQLVQLTNPGYELVRVTLPYTGERIFARLRAVSE